MKKIILVILLTCATFNVFAQKTWFVGGTGLIGYSNDTFLLGIEPEAGYEFTDWFAVGAGVGGSFSYSDGDYAILGIAETFARFTPWHNDIVYIDLKATGNLGFDSYIQLAQIGIRPGVRFRINDHWEVSADLGLFGASYTGYWTPSFGITGGAAGIWCAYRF